MGDARCLCHVSPGLNQLAYRRWSVLEPTLVPTQNHIALRALNGYDGPHP